jgi:hypothetical protein
MGQAKIKKSFRYAVFHPAVAKDPGLIEDSEFEKPVPSLEAVEASAKALKEIRGKSFAGRNPEVGKMIKCQVCRTRHRDIQVCTQKFKELWIEEDLETGELKTVYMVAAQDRDVEDVPGQRQPVDAPPGPTRNQIIGATPFKGKRKKPRLNKCAQRFVQLVHSLVPDEFTSEDLQKARKKAARILAKKYGRFNILPRKSAPQPKKEEDKSV